jgi:hypothetical protein
MNTCGILASHDYTLINIVVIGVAAVGLFFFHQRIMAGHKLQLIFGSCLTRGSALFTLNTLRPQPSFLIHLENDAHTHAFITLGARLGRPLWK